MKLYTTVHAHCDLPCGVYDPAQARIEATSVYTITRKYLESTDESFRARALLIKEERAEAVKRHLWVLWTDYFKPQHLRDSPQLHEVFWKATKAAGEAKHVTTLAAAEELLAHVDKVGELFARTKEGYDYSAVAHNADLQAGR